MHKNCILASPVYSSVKRILKSCICFFHTVIAKTWQIVNKTKLHIMILATCTSPDP